MSNKKHKIPPECRTCKVLWLGGKYPWCSKDYGRPVIKQIGHCRLNKWHEPKKD